EAAGFDSAWVFDAIGRGFLQPDPLTSLAIAATVTKRIELGTGVFQVPLRNPVDLARRVLTTHLAANGRLIFGVGAGSTPADFAAIGVRFADRFRLLDESLAIMRQLWKGERVGDAALGTIWPAAAGGPRVMIGSWAGSKWIGRAEQLGPPRPGHRPLPRPRRPARHRDQRGRRSRSARGEPRRARRPVRPQGPAIGSRRADAAALRARLRRRGAGGPASGPPATGRASRPLARHAEEDHDERR